MGTKSVGLLLLTLVALAGCGSATSISSSNAGRLPLVPGSTIITQSKKCDSGSNPFCAIEGVVVNRRFTSSGAFVASQVRLLHQLGWKYSAGDDGYEVAANSPDQKVRLTFAPAIDDLIGLDEHWIQRSWPIWAALDQTVLGRAPAMSIMLEAGPT